MEDTTAQEILARVERLLDCAMSRLRLDLADLAREYGGTADPPDEEIIAYLHRRDAVDLEADDEDVVLTESDESDEEEESDGDS